MSAGARETLAHGKPGHVCRTGAICGGVGRRYRARVRLYGHRRYQLLGKRTRSKRVAMRLLADAMLSTSYKRGDVLIMDEYYDPVPIVEMVRP